MKRFNQLILMAVLFYIGLATLSGYLLMQMEHEQKNQYRVEINRILHEMKQEEDIEHIVDNTYTYVQKVAFLSSEETSLQVINDFYSEENQHYIMIKPLVENEAIKGYVKFAYQLPGSDERNIFFLVEGCLFLLFLFILVLMIFIQRRIIQPFHQLSDLPERLACGHLKGGIKIEKSKYFQRYLWGMSQLKDTLDTSKTRQYELMKDKKQILLSLSHDIKTPLNLIKLYGKALEEGIYDDEQTRRDALHQIQIKSKGIERYVDQIITSSKEDIIDFNVKQIDFYLADLMQNVLMIYQEQCNLRNITLKVNPFENRLMKGDIHRVQEVFENLFENAFKYGDGKLITLDFYEEDYCQLIKLYNTGGFVSDNEFNHLFDSFYRGSNANGKQGSGLGLYICKELMNKMNGSIFAQRESDGMSFVLVFH